MNSNKKMIAIGAFIALLVLASTLVHKAYAAKSISLNSPVSFPVDI